MQDKVEASIMIPFLPLPLLFPVLPSLVFLTSEKLFIYS